MSLPIEPAPEKRGDKSTEVFTKCGICYSVVDEYHTCKECGVEFCKDCGNPMALVCTNCEDEEEEEKSKGQRSSFQGIDTPTFVAFSQ